MGLVLKVLGIIFLLLIAMALAVAVLVRAKVRKFVKHLEGVASRIPGVPRRIRLVPMARNDWEDLEAVGDLVDPLLEVGFQNGGEFEVAEIPGLRLQALVMPEQAVTAVVYEHPRAGVWIDLYSDYTDGTRVTYANTHHGRGANPTPGSLVERFPGLGAKALYQEFLNGRPGKPMKPASSVDFAAVFEQAYAEEMNRQADGDGAGADWPAAGRLVDAGTDAVAPPPA